MINNDFITHKHNSLNKGPCNTKKLRLIIEIKAISQLCHIDIGTRKLIACTSLRNVI